MAEGADAVFGALADATRRHLLDAIAGDGPATATELAADLPMSRQAVAKHLRILEDAGLVASARAGRETRYEAQPAQLAAAQTWIDEVGDRWESRLARLKQRLES